MIEDFRYRFALLGYKYAPRYAKGESPKCKTCYYFRMHDECSHPMNRACDRYSRKENKR